MNSWTGNIRRATYGVLSILTLAAAPLSAQRVPEVNAFSNPTADQLEQAAGRLAQQPELYRDAASAFEQAASLRGWADPRSADLLVNAARIYHAAGETGDALRVLRELAEGSLANGRVAAAADALIDLAWLANQSGRAHAARDAADQARRLIESPLIGAEERARLRARLAH